MLVVTSKNKIKIKEIYIVLVRIFYVRKLYLTKIIFSYNVRIIMHNLK